MAQSTACGPTAAPTTRCLFTTSPPATPQERPQPYGHSGPQAACGTVNGAGETAGGSSPRRPIAPAIPIFHNEVIGMTEATTTHACDAHEAHLRVRAARQMLSYGNRARALGIDPETVAAGLLAEADDWAGPA